MTSCRLSLLWGVEFVSLFCFLLRFRVYAFDQAAAHRSIVLRYACAPTATRSYLTTVCVLFCLLLLFWRSHFFRLFLYHCLFLFCVESDVRYVPRPPFRMVFFYLVATSKFILNRHGAHGRRGTLGLVRGYAGIETRMCAISATVQHFLCSGDLGRSCAFQRGRHDPKGSGVPRRGGWGGGGDIVRTRAEGGLGNILCRRRRRRIEIPEGLAKMMTTIVEVFGEFGLTVSEKKTETLLMRASEKQPKKGGSPPPPLVIEAAGQKYAQTAQFGYLGGLVNEDGELTQEINHRSRAAWACIRRFSRELFDRPRAPWRLKVRLLRAEAMEALLYGCMTWAPRHDHNRLLRRTHHRLLLRVIAAPTDSFRTLRPSRRLGAKAWKLPFDNGDFCSRGPWPDNPPGASRSG